MKQRGLGIPFKTNTKLGVKEGLEPEAWACVSLFCFDAGGPYPHADVVILRPCLFKRAVRTG